MTMHGNLLMLGDSFCEHKQHWPAWCAEALGYTTAQVHVYGQPGASWWPIRDHLMYCRKSKKDFMRDLSQVIIIHPNPQRIITQNTLIMANNAIVLPVIFNNTQLEEPQIASSLYYKYINDREFHAWAERNWFRELNELIGTVPVLHLFTTATSGSNADILNGAKVLAPLTELSLTVSLPRTDRNIKTPNHFTLAHNRVFAQQVTEMVQGRRVDFDATAFRQ
jgi:hypothetical protein